MMFIRDIVLLVLSKAWVGKTAPRDTRAPSMSPKYPSGTAPIWDISEKAELSQLKNAPMSQNEPAQMEAG